LDENVPYSEADMRSWGFEYWRCLPDGTVIAVGPMSFSNGRLFWDINEAGYDDFYCYDSVDHARDSMMAFDPAVDAEPFGWHRHYRSGRRRPDGDPTREFINH
jgi:hypothetical protein